MAELHIDSDWKKEAQEEKKRLAEQEAQRKAPAAPAAAAPASGGAAIAAAGKAPAKDGNATPGATFDALVQSIATQVFYYLGDLSTRGAEPMLNLDMAKHNIDSLNVLEEKTKGNLTDEELKSLDTVLYETRMRFISIASQVASYP